VLVVEDLLGTGTPDWDSGVPPEDFELRWAIIVSTDARDWINVHAEGVRDETLIVSVEWIASDDFDHRRERPVSINFSGPPNRGPAWDEKSRLRA
jgi:hypothetical protein